MGDDLRATAAQLECVSEAETGGGFFSRQNWMADADADACMNPRCASGTGRPMVFSFFNRRHHCRRCGRIFCDACSSGRLVIVDSGSEKSHRVCAACAIGVADIVARATATRAPKQPFLLASAPVDSLDACIRLCLAAGGEYTAGDAQDKLNSSVIGADEAWKTAWKGKTHQAIKMLERNFPAGQAIIALAIAGGPACDWERSELRNTFCPHYPTLKLKQLGDTEDLEAWLARNYGGGAAAARGGGAPMRGMGGGGNKKAAAATRGPATPAAAPPPPNPAAPAGGGLFEQDVNASHVMEQQVAMEQQAAVVHAAGMFLDGTWRILPDEANQTDEIATVALDGGSHVARFAGDPSQHFPFRMGANGRWSTNGWQLHTVSADKMTMIFSASEQPDAVWHRISCEWLAGEVAERRAGGNPVVSLGAGHVRRLTEQQEFAPTGNIVEWIVPDGVTSAKVEACGAQGGCVGSADGGHAAHVSGRFTMEAGQVLRILVGVQPDPCSDPSGATLRCGGGGGGTFVICGDGKPLLAAGGGGGACKIHPTRGLPASVDVGGVTSAKVHGRNPHSAGEAGHGGQADGNPANGCSGGGFLSDGQTHASAGHCRAGTAGLSFLNGNGIGGTARTNGGPGGFGGGGAGGGDGGGGGGGGYTGGGGACCGGGGGGSFNAGIEQFAAIREVGGSGMVIITFNNR